MKNAVRLIVMFVVPCSLVFSSLHSCSNKRSYSFANPQMPLQMPTALHTDGVYVQEAISWDTMYCIYRFYQNGRCYWSNWQKGNYRLEKLHRTDFPNGQQCYFRNQQDSVTVELYSEDYPGYILQNGILEDSHFCIYTVNPRGKVASNIYLPQPECFRFLAFTR